MHPLQVQYLDEMCEVATAAVCMHVRQCESPCTYLEAVLISHGLGQCFDLLDKGLGAFLHDLSLDVCP